MEVSRCMIMCHRSFLLKMIYIIHFLDLMNNTIPNNHFSVLIIFDTYKKKVIIIREMEKFAPRKKAESRRNILHL